MDTDSRTRRNPKDLETIVKLIVGVCIETHIVELYFIGGITHPSSQCCLSLLAAWWLCLCRVGGAGGGAGGGAALPGLGLVLRSAAASSLTASSRCALEDSPHSRSSSDTRL